MAAGVGYPDGIGGTDWCWAWYMSAAMVVASSTTMGAVNCKVRRGDFVFGLDADLCFEAFSKQARIPLRNQKLYPAFFARSRHAATEADEPCPVSDPSPLTQGSLAPNKKHKAKQGLLITKSVRLASLTSRLDQPAWAPLSISFDLAATTRWARARCQAAHRRRYQHWQLVQSFPRVLRLAVVATRMQGYLNSIENRYWCVHLVPIR